MTATNDPRNTGSPNPNRAEDHRHGASSHQQVPGSNHEHHGRQNGPYPADDDEISLAELYHKFRSWLRLLRRHRRLIAGTMAAALALGVFVAYGTKEEYVAENKILSYSADQQDRRTDQLRGLAGMAGIDIGSRPEGLISEAMFPTLLQTYPLASRLADEPIRFREPDTLMSAYTYFDEFYEDDIVEITKSWTFGLPRKMIGWALAPVRRVRSAGEEPDGEDGEDAVAVATPETGPASFENRVAVTGEAGEISRIVSKPLLEVDRRRRSRVNTVARRIETEREGRVITVKATMPDPWAAADLANTATAILMQELTNYEIRKTQDQIAFLEKQYDEVRERFEIAQRNWLEFQDRTTGTVSTITQIEAQRLQTEYNRASSRYNNLSEQLDQARYRLNEETPLFTELDPVQVPDRPASPNRERIILLWLFLGAFASTGFITGRHLIRKLDRESRRLPEHRPGQAQPDDGRPPAGNDRSQKTTPATPQSQPTHETRA